MIKIGYQRIKQKIKDLRQDYRNAMTVGRRSRSGKLVENNWDILKNISGRSPAVINLRNARCSLQNELNDKEDNESGNMNGENVSRDKIQQLDGNIEEPIAKKSTGGLAPTAKFVDNKRKLLFILFIYLFNLFKVGTILVVTNKNQPPN